MLHCPEEILSILDHCCEIFTFPMLDNGYIYLAATRLSLYRSIQDWAMVIEVFGFSPRAGFPDTCIQTFASRLYNRDLPENYVNRAAYERYLTRNPHNDSRSIFPIQEGLWQEAGNEEFVSEDTDEVFVRNQSIKLPDLDKYSSYGIKLEQWPRVLVFEFCRFLAGVEREKVLATPQEQRISILPEMEQILQLEEWHHPDIANDERPSGSVTFQQLAKVLATGESKHYHSSLPANTHWTNWPESGRL
jgi:hypothetical protein